MKIKSLKGWWSPDLSPYLELSTPTGELFDVVVDSGFNEELMLPESLIEKLGLERRGEAEIELANGLVVRTETYLGNILWFGQPKQVLVQATNSNDGLLGTPLAIAFRSRACTQIDGSHPG
ncbi:MAG: hypothetical protein ACREEM_53785 [Blastocatellia bacterium]